MEPKNMDVYHRTPEWVKKAIFTYLKDSGYTFPKCFDSLIEVTPDGGATITITDRPKPVKAMDKARAKVGFPLINRVKEWWNGRPPVEVQEGES